MAYVKIENRKYKIYKMAAVDTQISDTQINDMMIGAFYISPDMPGVIDSQNLAVEMLATQIIDTEWKKMRTKLRNLHSSMVAFVNNIWLQSTSNVGFGKTKAIDITSDLNDMMCVKTRWIRAIMNQIENGQLVVDLTGYTELARELAHLFNSGERNKFYSFFRGRGFGEPFILKNPPTIDQTTYQTVRDAFVTLSIVIKHQKEFVTYCDGVLTNTNYVTDEEMAALILKVRAEISKLE